MSKTGEYGEDQPMFETHPVARLFPAMTDEEFARLVEDIRRQGVKQPIVVQNGAILDGQHRYRAARHLGIECPRTEWNGSNAWLDAQSANLVRRNLRADQIAAIRKIAERQFPEEAAVTDRERVAAKARQRMHAATAPGQPKNTSGHVTGSERGTVTPTRRPMCSSHPNATRAPELADLIGARLGISGSTQKRIDRLAREAPDQLAVVARGEKSVAQALREAKEAKTRALQGGAAAMSPPSRTAARRFHFNSALARLDATLERIASRCSPTQLPQLARRLREAADALVTRMRPE